MKAFRPFTHWIPAAFCAYVVYIYVNGTAGWQGMSLWLPLCFFYVGAVTHSQEGRIRQLEAEVERFRTARPAP